MNRTASGASRQTLQVGSLVVLLVAALFVEAVPVVHAHLDGDPGFYNATCGLSLLAALTPDAPLPTADIPGGRLPELPAPIETPESSPSSPFLLGANWRAPPLA